MHLIEKQKQNNKPPQINIKWSTNKLKQSESLWYSQSKGLIKAVNLYLQA